jgi:hypothetical protein
VVLTDHVACMTEMRYSYKILIGNPEGRRLQGRSRHRCERNIKVDFREIGLEGVD